MKRLRTAALVATALLASFGVTLSHAAGPGSHMAMEHGIFTGMEKVHGKLQLTAVQETAWQEAVSLAASIGGQAQALHQQMRTAVSTELAKAQPDLAALAQQGDSTHQQVAALHKQVRDKWLALYATLSAEQQGQVADFLRQRLQRSDKMGNRMGKAQ